MVCPNKSNPQYKFLVEKYGEAEANYHWFTNSDKYNIDTDINSKLASLPVLTEIGDRIKEINPNVIIKYITDGDAVELGVEGNYVKSYLDKNTIYINVDRASAADPLEEMGHLWLAGLKQEMPELYNLFIDTSNQAPNQLKQSLLHDYKELNLNVEEQGEEVFVKLLSKRLANNFYNTPHQSFFDKFKSVLRDAKDNFFKFFKKLFGKTSKTEDPFELLDYRLDQAIKLMGDLKLNKRLSKHKVLKKKYSLEAKTMSQADLVELLKDKSNVSVERDENSYTIAKKVYYRVTKLIQNKDFSYIFGGNLSFDKVDWKNRMINLFKPKTSSTSTKEEQLKNYQKELNNRLKFFDILPELGTSFHYGMELMFKEDTINKDRFKELVIEDIKKSDSKFKSTLDTIIGDFVLNQLFEIATNFKKQIVDKHGADAEYLTEIKIHTDKISEALKKGGKSGIAGTADLVVVDRDGTVFTYDYKFSGKESNEWSDAKQRSMELQQAIYKKIITTYSDKEKIKFGGSFIVPVFIQTNVDTAVQNENYKNENLTIEKLELGSAFDVSDPLTNLQVNRIIDTPALYKESLKKNNDNVFHVLESFFNLTRRESKEPTNLEVQAQIELAKEKAKGTANPNKFFNFYEGDGGKVQEINEENITKFLKAKSLASPAISFLSNYSKAVKEKPYVSSKQLEKFIEFYIRDYDEEVSEGVTKKVYTWEAISTPQMQELDIVLMVNKKLGVFHVLSFSENPFDQKLDVDTDDTTILANFKNIQSKAKGDHLFKPTYENIGHIKAGLFLLDNLNELLNLRPQFFISVNRDSNGKENVVRYTDPRSVFHNIKKMGEVADGNKTIDNPLLKTAYFDKDYDYLKTKNYRQNILELLDIYSKKGAYNSELRKETEEYREELSNATNETLIDILSARVSFLIEKSASTSDEGPELGSIREEYRRELELVSEILMDAQSVMYIDADDLLATMQITGRENALTTPITEMTGKATSHIYSIQEKAFGNFRLMFDENTNEFRNIFRATYPQNITLDARYGDYKNLLEYKLNEDTNEWFLTMNFRNPKKEASKKNKYSEQNELTKQEAALIEFIADVTTKAREAKGIEVTEETRYEVPLVRASSMTKFREIYGKSGVVRALKESISETMDNIRNPENLLGSEQYRSKLQFRTELTDTFSFSDNPEKRKELLAENDITEFEINIEDVMMMYYFNDAKLKTVNKAIPAINAYKSILTLMQNTNSFQYYDELTKYIDKIFLLGNIFGKPSVTKDDELNLFISNKVKSFGSNLAIGFSPSTSLINFYTNLWNMYSATMGGYSDRLDFASIKKAATFVTVHAKETIDNINFLDSLNVYFGIHNMDPSRMSSEMKRDRGGLTNFERWAHILNTYPDFMFRMTLFLSEAIKEGVIDIKNGRVTSDSAVQYDENTNSIKYYLTKDKRFKEMFLNQNTDEAKAQKSLYDTIFKSLEGEYKGVVEGKINRPYDSKMLDSKRRLSDSIFQDVSPQNKSWFERQAVGSLVMMFKKWMEAKYYIYWREPSLLDSYGQYETVKKGDKFYTDWKGRQMEGILQSMFYYLSDAYKSKSFIQAGKNLEDYQVRNLKHGITDLYQFLIITILTSALEEQDMERKKDLDQWLLRVMKNSAKDLFIINTLNTLTGSNNSIFVVGYMNTLITDMVQAIVNPASVPGFLTNFGVIRPVVQMMPD